jgi:hypothetical protein
VGLCHIISPAVQLTISKRKISSSIVFASFLMDSGQHDLGLKRKGEGREREEIDVDLFFLCSFV